MRNIIAFLIIFDFFFITSFLCKAFVFQDIQLWILAYFVIVCTAVFYVAYVALMRGKKG